MLSSNQDSRSALDAARAWMDNAPANVVAVQGTAAPALIAASCDSLGSWTPLWMSCYSAMAPSTFYEQGALLLAVKPNADAGRRTNLKGRLNFSTLGTGPGHIITLSDSDFQKTVATANNRPANDANDAFIGYDHGDGGPENIGISLGAPKSISSYIGNVGDGKNWLERLTSNLKSFKVPVTTNSPFTSTVPSGDRAVYGFLQYSRGESHGEQPSQTAGLRHDRRLFGHGGHRRTNPLWERDAGSRGSDREGFQSPV